MTKEDVIKTLEIKVRQYETHMQDSNDEKQRVQNEALIYALNYAKELVKKID